MTPPPQLPDFPWDALTPYRERAAQHAPVVDLSVGTPVDPVPDIVQRALVDAANSPGYPTTQGSDALRAAVVDWQARRCGVTVRDDAVLPTIGSKEFVAALPTLLGVGVGDVVVIPSLAYPTYEIGALLCGASIMRTDATVAVGPVRPRLVWVNSPSNPTGKVLPSDHLRKVVQWARERGAVVASDECYLELGWDEQPISILHPDVCDGSHDSLLAVHSLSKRSNLAGYRAGFVSGDPALIEAMLEIRKHSGAMVPTPVQAAMTAALSDDTHVREQRKRYRARRDVLLAAVRAAGFTVTHSEAGLYLWITTDEDCWDTVGWFADNGVVVAPGSFYGPAGSRHVRVALTALDDDIDLAATRIAG